MPQAALPSQPIATNPALMQELDLAAETMKSEYLDRDIEVELARAWRDHGDKNARDRLVLSHGRLASKIAKSMLGYGIPLNDLIQEASLGLMKAADKFDPEKGWRFATYARWWVRAAIQDTVMRDSSSVRTKSSSSNRTAFFSLRKIEARAELKLRSAGIAVTSDAVHAEMARSMGMPLERLLDLKASLPVVSSLNETIAKNGEEMGQKIDLLVSDAEEPEEMMIRESSQAQATNLIAIAMSALSEREMTIIQKRTMSLEPVTLEVLSIEFDVTRERIRQIEVSAMEKLRKKLASLGVRDLDNLF